MRERPWRLEGGTKVRLGEGVCSVGRREDWTWRLLWRFPDEAGMEQECAFEDDGGGDEWVPALGREGGSWR